MQVQIRAERLFISPWVVCSCQASWKQAKQTYSYPHWEGAIVRDVHYPPSMLAEWKRFAWIFVNEVRQELHCDRDFHTKVTYIQGGYKEERFHDETAEELG